MPVGFLEDTETLVDLQSRIAEAEGGESVSLETATHEWIRSARAREGVAAVPKYWSSSSASGRQGDILRQDGKAVAVALFGAGIGVAAAAVIALLLSNSTKDK